MNLSIFLSVILLIFVRSSESSRNVTKRDTEKKAYIIEWKPYHCQLDFDKTFGSSLLYFILDSGHLYFLFTEFVVRIKRIRISTNYLRRFDENDRDSIFDFYEEPEYARYADMKYKPEIFGRNMSAFFQVILPDGEIASYAYETVDNKTRKPHKLIFDMLVVGKLINFDKDWEKRHIKPLKVQYDLTFVRWDHVKWFEISYNNSKNEIIFWLYTYDKSALVQSVSTRFREPFRFPVRFAAYYEYEVKQDLDTFQGYLIDIDKGDVVNIRSLLFSVAKTKINFPERIDVSTTLESLLRCRTQRVFLKKEYKGIYFSTDTYLFYVFINNFYLKGRSDLLKLNFQIGPMQLVKSAKTIDFNGIKPLFERSGIKYIKQARNSTYITVNPSETYRVEFKDGEKHGEGQIVAKKVNDKFVHLCPNQILEISRIIFCFEATVYYFVSKDDLNSYINGTQLHSIGKLFNQARIPFPSGYEKLNFIAKYRASPPETDNGEYILFFFDHLIFQVCRTLLAVRKIRNNTKEEYELYLRVNRNDFELTQHTNCLFHLHDCKIFPKIVYKFTGPKELVNDLIGSTKSPESENGSILVISFALLFLMFSFLTVLLLVKSSGRFGRKSTETQPEPSNLVGKSDDLKLNELKQHESSTGPSDKTQNDSQLNSSNLSLSQTAIQSSQLDSPSTGSTNGIATELPTNQIKTEQNVESIKKKDKNYDI